MSALVTKAPCAKCPFRNDVPIYLRADRRQEIARTLIDGGTFPCHATVDYSGEDDEGNTIADESNAAQCGGAVASLELAGGSNQLMRIAERLGDFDEDRPDHHDLVWSLHEWPTLAEGATADEPEWIEAEGDTCSIVDAGCEAPAGYLGASGGVVRGTDLTDNYCPSCGEACCPTCMGDNEICPNCAEWEEVD